MSKNTVKEVPTALQAQGVTLTTFRSLVRRGWFNADGMELSWTYWRERAEKEERERLKREAEEYERAERAASEGSGVVLDKDGKPLARRVAYTRTPNRATGPGVPAARRGQPGRVQVQQQPVALFRGRAIVKRNQRPGGPGRGGNQEKTR